MLQTATSRVQYWTGFVEAAVAAARNSADDEPPNMQDTARLVWLLHTGSHRSARRYLWSIGWSGTMRGLFETIGRGLQRHGADAVKTEILRQAGCATAIFDPERLWTGHID